MLNAVAAWPSSSMSTSSTAPPAACSAARYEPSLATVSGSRYPPPDAAIRSIASTYSGGCTAVRSAWSTSEDSTRS